jgi:hypothetical protein
MIEDVNTLAQITKRAYKMNFIPKFELITSDIGQFRYIKFSLMMPFTKEIVISTYNSVIMNGWLDGIIFSKANLNELKGISKEEFDNLVACTSKGISRIDSIKNLIKTLSMNLGLTYVIFKNENSEFPEYTVNFMNQKGEIIKKSMSLSYAYAFLHGIIYHKGIGPSLIDYKAEDPCKIGGVASFTKGEAETEIADIFDCIFDVNGLSTTMYVTDLINGKFVTYLNICELDHDIREDPNFIAKVNEFIEKSPISLMNPEDVSSTSIPDIIPIDAEMVLSLKYGTLETEKLRMTHEEKGKIIETPDSLDEIKPLTFSYVFSYDTSLKFFINNLEKICIDDFED